MSNLKANLIYLMERAGLNPTSLSRATGVPQPSIHRVVSGDSLEPKRATLEPLAAYFGVSVDWLIEGDSAAWDRLSDAVTAAAGPTPTTRFKKVPLSSYVRCEGGAVGCVTGAVSGATVDFPARDADAYALRVSGDGMLPRVKAGEFLVLEPHRAPEPGDDALVTLVDGRRYLAELLYQRGDTVTWGAFCTGKTMTLDVSEIDSTHYIAAILPRGASKTP